MAALPKARFGGWIRFTHIPTSRIMRLDPNSDTITDLVNGTNHVNGLAFDNQGRLFGCCSGGRSIVRFNQDGSAVTVADGLGWRAIRFTHIPTSRIMRLDPNSGW